MFAPTPRPFRAVAPGVAVYVALAEALEVPLLTCDGSIARAPGHRADVDLV